MRADEQKSHRRLSSGASQHQMTKPEGTADRVNAAVVHGRLMFLFGEICLAGGRDGLREGHGESCGNTTGPYRLFLAARPAVTPGVTGQKSADGVVAKRPP